jgi:hypothetical protein
MMACRSDTRRSDTRRSDTRRSDTRRSDTRRSDTNTNTNNNNNIVDLELENNSYEYDFEHLTRMYKKISVANANKYIRHPLIENYDAIIRKDDYIKIDIIETHILDGMEEIAILKTHWLRLIQRKWKRLYRIKMEKIKKKISYHYLRRREIGMG